MKIEFHPVGDTGIVSVNRGDAVLALIVSIKNHVPLESVTRLMVMLNGTASGDWLILEGDERGFISFDGPFDSSEEAQEAARTKYDRQQLTSFADLPNGMMGVHKNGKQVGIIGLRTKNLPLPGGGILGTPKRDPQDPDEWTLVTWTEAPGIWDYSDGYRSSDEAREAAVRKLG
jgi:hypothetical protein